MAVRPAAIAQSHVYVSAILEGRDGSLWFGTDAGLWRLQGEQLTVQTSRNGLPGDYAAALMAEADGTLWVGTNPGGLARFKAGRWSVILDGSGLADANFNAMVEDGVGNVWFVSDRALYSVAKRELDAVADGGGVARVARVREP